MTWPAVVTLIGLAEAQKRGDTLLGMEHDRIVHLQTGGPGFGKERKAQLLPSFSLDRCQVKWERFMGGPPWSCSLPKIHVGRQHVYERPDPEPGPILMPGSLAFRIKTLEERLDALEQPVEAKDVYCKCGHSGQYHGGDLGGHLKHDQCVICDCSKFFWIGSK